MINGLFQIQNSDIIKPFILKMHSLLAGHDKINHKQILKGLIRPFKVWRRLTGRENGQF